MTPVTGIPFVWASDKGSWHFLRVDGEAAADIRLESLGLSGAFGSVRVVAVIGEIEWRTSLFRDSRGGGYLLPLKADVRRRAGVKAGQALTVNLRLQS